MEEREEKPTWRKESLASLQWEDEDLSQTIAIDNTEQGGPILSQGEQQGERCSRPDSVPRERIEESGSEEESLENQARQTDEGLEVEGDSDNGQESEVDGGDMAQRRVVPLLKLRAFSGREDEDAVEWLDQYKSISQCNRWEPVDLHEIFGKYLESMA